MSDARASSGNPRIVENPFYVLELAPECAAVEVERQGNKLLAMIELGFVEAESYDTPFGARRRDGDAVRRAMAELRDPERRLVHELWAAMDPTLSIETDSDDAPTQPGANGWAAAMSVFGWGPRTR